MSAYVHRLSTVSLIRRLRAAGPLPKRPRPIPRRQAPDRIGTQYTAAIVRDVCARARQAFEEVAGEILALLAELPRHDAGEPPDLRLAEKARAREERAARAKGGAIGRELERAAGEGHAAYGEEIGRDLEMAQRHGERAARLVDKAAKAFADKFHPTALHEVVKHFGKATDEHARAQLDRQLRAAIAVPLSAIEKPHRDRLEEWAARNVDLIVTVPERYFDRLRQDVEEAFAASTHPSTLAQAFAETYEISASNAERIARDQTLKLSADLNHARMEAIGITRAVWTSAHDNRVCDECFDLDGQEFDLSEGIDGVMPGWCHPGDRCYAAPLVGDLLGD